MKRKLGLLAVAVLTTTIFTSCWTLASLLYNGPQPNRVLENVEFPDGKVARAYIFNNANNGQQWYPGSAAREDPSFSKAVEREVERSGASVDWISGRASTDVNVIYYYMVNDFGQLSTYLTANSFVCGWTEDETGFYVLVIAPPENFSTLVTDIDDRMIGRGLLGYRISYIPKAEYVGVVPSFTIPPTKTQPLDPASVPDSNINLTPTGPSGTGSYYYDANLAYQLQWLAVRIACIGTYDMAYTGDFRARNPTDYYTTSYIKGYLAQSGRTTRGTVTFEGICFDYADFACLDLENSTSGYSGVAQYWMAGTFADSNDIVLYRIAASGEASTLTINGTPVVVFSHQRIKAHDGATSHAWVWVQANDGTMYWLDPTWTDNSGRPVYGIVRNGEEVQLTPDSRLCVR